MDKNKVLKALNVGKTARMMDEGLSVTEIAMKLKKSECEVREMINIIKQARENKTTE